MSALPRSESDRIVVSLRNVAMGQTLHFALQEKQQPFSALDHDEVGTHLPNGDLQHLREMMLRSA